MKVFIIAGEPSGDALGQAVMSGLKSLRKDVTFVGVGGPLMEAEGLTSNFPMSELSVMGLAEILPKYFHLKRRIAETIDAVVASGADLLLTIDSPDFCLRVAKGVKARIQLHTVHYVAPSVWAWRPRRAEKLVGVVDHVLALLPFEPPYIERHGIACDFVGHPVVAQRQATAEEIAAFRTKHDIAGPIVLALPGSRSGEVARLAEPFVQSLNPFLNDTPQATVIVPAAQAVEEQVRSAFSSLNARSIILSPGIDEASILQKRAAFGAADIALAASGTVSLELAAARTPMVIAYDMAWLSRVLLQRMLLIDTVTLVNLVSDTRHVPEFIGANCKPSKIVTGLQQVFSDPKPQLKALDLTMERLGQGGEAPGLRAAKAILARLES